MPSEMRLDIEWGRLQIEQSYWSSHAFVERVANAKMQMSLPQTKDVRIVRPSSRCRTSNRARATSDTQAKSYRWRSAVVFGSGVCLARCGLAARAVELQLVEHGFLAQARR